MIRIGTAIVAVLATFGGCGGHQTAPTTAQALASCRAAHLHGCHTETDSDGSTGVYGRP